MWSANGAYIQGVPPCRDAVKRRTLRPPKRLKQGGKVRWRLLLPEEKNDRQQCEDAAVFVSRESGL